MNRERAHFPANASVGNGDHAVNLLTGPVGSSFEYCRLAVQVRFVNLG
jgi:hypothetical protein